MKKGMEVEWASDGSTKNPAAANRGGVGNQRMKRSAYFFTT
jgi:hypothetical protein